MYTLDAYNVANVIYTIGTLCAFIDANIVWLGSHKNSWCVILYEHPPSSACNANEYIHTSQRRDSKRWHALLHVCSKKLVNTSNCKHLDETRISLHSMFTCILFEVFIAHSWRSFDPFFFFKQSSLPPSYFFVSSFWLLIHHWTAFVLAVNSVYSKQSKYATTVNTPCGETLSCCALATSSALFDMFVYIWLYRQVTSECLKRSLFYIV